MDKIFSIFPIGRNKELFKFSKPIRARLYFFDSSIDLLVNKKSSENIFDYLGKLDKKKLDCKRENLFEVHHLYYELSDILLFQKNSMYQNSPLAIEIIYSEKNIFELKQHNLKPKVIISSKISRENYLIDINNGIKELYSGNSYQFNFTSEFIYQMEKFSIDELASSFFSEKEKLGQFAHLTFIQSLGTIILSNSPECLFQLKKKNKFLDCTTLPIKGSHKIDEGKNIKSQWLELTQDKKNQGELFMIIDLLKNDLNSIELPIAKVIRKKAKLIVPGIIHQMGIINIRLSPQVSMGKIIRALFPGGSITGAPKKRTVEILQKIERRPRGIYTGSTLLIQNGRVDCSINIRTAEINLNKLHLKYGAGGGITLKSKPDDEFNEMNLKVDSFISTFFKS